MMRYLLSWGLAFGLSLVSTQDIAQARQTWRDPTKPAMMRVTADDTQDDGKKAEATYQLSSIIISSTRRLALINAIFVRVGDRIGEARVVKINRNSVVLSAPGKKITLYLLDQRGWE